ncbi:MAG: hypothetical protein ACI8RZ_004232 [Myxococcota bacterium]|jgi:hypothetical protein
MKEPSAHDTKACRRCVMLAIFLTLTGCDECLQTKPLEAWCLDEQMYGSLANVACEQPTADEVELTGRCGRFDVAVISGGFSGRRMYFDDDGEMVAVEFFDDTWGTCNEIATRYGRRIGDCDWLCSYDEDGVCVE